ncbi:uncharacterized protein LOC117180455 [Belonocnema kinseyi]|uniref:uncharacterized protein LOC117180455 n=1 Tax=Belonocnema kinseyi TaxID=2817044 RepID=UPI00143D1F82|nr:uncharacterized protein LOC117180455 [Belonocnema kinseyi]
MASSRSVGMELPDVKNVFLTQKGSKEEILVDESIIKQFKNFSRIIRVSAYFIRFARNCKLKNNQINGPLNTVELQESLLALARLSQGASFQTEINFLKDKKRITKGKLSSLNPFLGQADILRVGGRLENSKFSEDKKHPIVIDSNHTFSKLIFQQEHVKLLHAAD